VKPLTIAKLQWLMTWRNPEQLMPLLLVPLSTFVAAAIIDNGGRPDLLYYCLIAISVMSIAQTGFMAASDLFVSDRSSGTLEAMLVTVANYPAVLVVRILSVTATGAVGGIFSYALLKLVFSARLSIHHPIVAIVTLVGIVVGTSCMALFLSALICYARSARAVQNSMSGPMFLMSGVLVPVGLLAPWLEWPGKLIYLSWAAELLRESFLEAELTNLSFRLIMLLATGIVWALVGGALLSKMLDRLRLDGKLTG
jgi:ABC-2 type transport system permease protein